LSPIPGQAGMSQKKKVSRVRGTYVALPTVQKPVLSQRRVRTKKKKKREAKILTWSGGGETKTKKMEQKNNTRRQLSFTERPGIGKTGNSAEDVRQFDGVKKKLPGT